MTTRWQVPVVALALVLLAGCGDGTERESPPQASTYDGCTTANFGRTGASLATLRVGDEPVRLRLVPKDSSRCPGSLIARAGGGVRGSRVADLGLDRDSARVVGLGGPAGDLLAVRSRSDDNGVQTHLFASDATEVRTGDGPLLPALDDGHRVPADATCAGRGRLAVVTAEAHQPPGIVLAWDVTRTTYLVHGHEVQQVRRRVVDTAVADPVLRKERPGLYDDRLLGGCVR